MYLLFLPLLGVRKTLEMRLPWAVKRRKRSDNDASIIHWLVLVPLLCGHLFALDGKGVGRWSTVCQRVSVEYPTKHYTNSVITLVCSTIIYEKNVINISNIIVIVVAAITIMLLSTKH